MRLSLLGKVGFVKMQPWLTELIAYVMILVQTEGGGSWDNEKALSVNSALKAVGIIKPLPPMRCFSPCSWEPMERDSRHTHPSPVVTADSTEQDGFLLRFPQMPRHAMQSYPLFLPLGSVGLPSKKACTGFKLHFNNQSKDFSPYIS